VSEEIISYIKEHKEARTVAIVDVDLLGAELIDPETNHKIKISEHFFGGIPATKHDLIRVMREALKKSMCLNIIGNKSIEVAKELGMVPKGSIRFYMDPKSGEKIGMIIIFSFVPFLG